MSIKVYNYTDDKYIDASDTRAERIAIIGNKGIGFRGEILRNGTTDTYTVKEGSHAFIGGLSVRFLSDESFDLIANRYIVIETTYTAPDFYTCTVISVDEVSSEIAGEVPKHVPIYDKTLGIQNDLKKSAGRFGAYTKSEADTLDNQAEANAINYAKGYGLDGQVKAVTTTLANSWTPITLPIVTGFESTDSGSTANRWAKFATVEMTAQYAATNALISIMGGNSGAGSTINAFALIKIRVKQQDALGISPRVGIDIIGNNSIEPNDIVAVTTENTANKTKVELYVKVNTSYEVYTWTPLHVRGDRNLTIHSIPSYVASLPVGSQVTARAPIGHAAYMSKSSQASIAPSTRTRVGLDSGLAYGDMVISTASNRITVPKDGSYQISALATMYIESNKYAEISLYKNGSLYRNIGRTEATNSAYQQVTGIDISGAFAGDYFELYVYHTGAYSAAALNFRITMAYLGGL